MGLGFWGWPDHPQAQTRSSFFLLLLLFFFFFFFFFFLPFGVAGPPPRAWGLGVWRGWSHPNFLPPFFFKKKKLFIY
jgi:hypothetical protein